MSKKYKEYVFGIETPEGYTLDNLEECMEEMNHLLKDMELLKAHNRDLKLTVAKLSDRAATRHDQFAVIKLALDWCREFGLDSEKEVKENCVGAYVAGYGLGSEDSLRLDWILRNYSLSCGVNRFEIDDRMKERGDLRD